MIYVTGDTHAELDRFKNNKLKKGDTLIVCGDFGFIFDPNSEERRKLKWLSKRRYDIIFVDGYNDNQKLIDAYPEEKWNGGRVRDIAPNIKMLMRGEVFEIEGKKIFAFGGAERVDSRYNLAEESKLPSEKDMLRGLHMLKKNEYEVDYIVTYDAPQEIRLFIDMANSEINYVNSYLQEVAKKVKFKTWYFGKYHMNKKISQSYQIVFTDIIEMK